MHICCLSTGAIRRAFTLLGILCCWLVSEMGSTRKLSRPSFRCLGTVVSNSLMSSC
uniref:Uncharacterized protein n=1 Tax=Arundo donax TaxID=35708 RepID=A0A0A9E9Y6_ARUDO